jgi:hypothetical protein
VFALYIKLGVTFSPILNPACMVFIKLFIFSILLLGKELAVLAPLALYELINSSPKIK